MRESVRALIAFFCLSAILLAADGGPSEAVITGERLDPALYGPAVVESMDVVLERDRRATREPGDPRQGETRIGRWMVPPRNATSPTRSGEHHLVNEWGDTRMSIGFPQPVNVECAYFSGQESEAAWTPGVRVIGFRRGEEVASTDWFTEIGREPALFPIGLRGVDRIEIQAVPRIQGGGWYAMDDLTYTVTTHGGASETVVLDFEDCQYKQDLTESGYAGLDWEFGTGDFRNQGIPSPVTIEEAPDEAAPDEPPTARGLATPPVLVSSFQGVIRGDAGSFSYPPDTCGAVGPAHFVETVNRNFAVYRKSDGVRIVSTTLGSFLPGSNGDPRVLYDQYSGRWVIIVSDFSARVYLAVSQTSDPTGAWFKTNILVSQGSDASCWPDYPTLGLNASGYYVASYMVGCGMSFFAIDKAPLIAPAPSLGTVTAFRGLPFEGAIQPVQTYGVESAEYVVSRNSSNLRIRRLSGPLTSPTLSELGFIPIGSNLPPNDVPSQGSSTPLDSVDNRLMNAVYRDGSIWTAHTVDVGGRAACRWYQAQVSSMSLVQSGTISDSVRHYFFPSIAVNFRGDAALGFSGSHGGEFAGAWYCGRLGIDPPGAMSFPALLRAGAASQNNIDGFGRNRWGDYSLTTVDPTNERLFWTIQEYGHATDIWGTYVGVIGYPDCNENGIDDAEDIALGTSADCNDNVLPDECELEGNDCEGNQIPDDCQISGGQSLDCDLDGVPDECEPDCNANGTADDCDVIAGVSADCQENGVPDECDIEGGASIDCTGNGIPDECETDCNQNGIRDDCDLAAGTSLDCNLNETPDECDIATRLAADCNDNEVPDDCDIASGASGDCNTNRIPDECDSEVCYPAWDGFEPAPPFTLGTIVHGIDYDGDGRAWQNASGSASIVGAGCPAGQGRALKIISQTPPTSDSVESEYFRTVDGQLGPEASAWSLSFDARSEAFLNPRIDWRMAVRDGVTGADAIILHWASTQSSYPGVVAANGRGKLLVVNPAGSPAFISSDYTLSANACYSVKVTLNPGANTVELHVNGALRVVTGALSPLAGRLDYFHISQAANGQASGNLNRLAMDNVTICESGTAVPAGGLRDCDGNGVLDDCDIESGAAADCDFNEIPDGCQPRGDFDGDGDVDLADYPEMVSCLTAPCAAPPCVPALYARDCCARADFDGDGDADLEDFGGFQAAP